MQSNQPTPTNRITGNHTQTGQLGEDRATAFLISQNYQIIARNFHCRFGEIDIIALDQNAKQIAFVEVKTRIDQSFGEPQESVNFSKKRKILKTINAFFENFAQNKRPFCYCSWRLDVIALKLDQKSRLKEINHFKNILDG